MSEYKHRQTIFKGIETGVYEVYEVGSNEVYESGLHAWEARNLAARLTIDSLKESQHASEIATLRDELTTTQAALESASERIKALESFVRGIADSVMPEKEVNQALLFRATVRDAQWLLGKETQAPVSEGAPKFKIGDRVKTIVGGFSDAERIVMEVHPNGLYKVATPSVDVGNVPFWEHELIPYSEENKSELPRTPKPEKPHACYYCNGTGTDSLGLACDFCMGSGLE